ncbi:hypothetical protein [Streptomyces sp. NPDC046978]|uniref:hypothetical protein n=1 Tax=Streptomyces sp. NPDC046978 TaxID=3154704 RepID=UPI0033C18C1E
MPKAPDHRIVQWLARSHPDPEQAERELQTGEGVTLLGLGDRIAAVRMPSALVHAALGTAELQEVAELLEARLGGAVIYDVRQPSGPTYYALIQGHARVTWDLDRFAVCLGDGVFLGVPAPHRIEPPGPFWIVPPQFDGHLCRSSSVRELVSYGALRLQVAEPAAVGAVAEGGARDVVREV